MPWEIMGVAALGNSAGDPSVEERAAGGVRMEASGTVGQDSKGKARATEPACRPGARGGRRPENEESEGGERAGAQAAAAGVPAGTRKRKFC